MSEQAQTLREAARLLRRRSSAALVPELGFEAVAQAAYAATMHPGVGLRLAEWLHTEADLDVVGAAWSTRHVAVRLANLILDRPNDAQSDDAYADPDLGRTGGAEAAVARVEALLPCAPSCTCGGARSSVPTVEIRAALDQAAPSRQKSCGKASVDSAFVGDVIGAVDA